MKKKKIRNIKIIFVDDFIEGLYLTIFEKTNYDVYVVAGLERGRKKYLELSKVMNVHTYWSTKTNITIIMEIDQIGIQIHNDTILTNTNNSTKL